MTRNLFRSRLGKVPENVEFACHSAEAILAPDLTTKQQHVRAMIGIAGGVTGLAAVLTGLAGIFGWGAGVLATLKVFFVGLALGGPIAWIAGGITAASIATYFALASDDVEKSSKAFKALKVGVMQAIDVIWKKHHEDLSKPSKVTTESPC